MDTIKASKIPWKHVICCLIILVIFVLTIAVSRLSVKIKQLAQQVAIYEKSLEDKE